MDGVFRPSDSTCYTSSSEPFRFYNIIKYAEKKKRKTVVGLERGPLSLVSTTEELLDRKVVVPV
jgi:hypothetical protein